MAQILTHTWPCTAFRTGNRTRLNPTNWHSRARHFVGLWVGERREGTGGGGAKAWRKSKQQQEGCQEWQSTKEDGRCQSKQQELRVPFSRSVSPQNIKVQHLSAICNACWKESRKQKNKKMDVSAGDVPATTASSASSHIVGFCYYYTYIKKELLL